MTALARFPIIVGPTAGGKSDLAVHVAQLISSRLPNHDSPPPLPEIITADAFQIFRGLDIGTAKPTAADRAGIPHHLIDIVDPRDRFSVHDWLTLAHQTIADIRSRGNTPIVVGGTHLYIKALLDGLFEGPSPDPALRAALSARPPADLRAELERIDPATAARLHPNDLRRTVRALEVFRLTGKPISAHQQQWDRDLGSAALRAASSTPAPALVDQSGGAGVPPASPSPPSRILIGLDWPSELLNPRINARVRAMLDRGLVDEVRALWKSGAFDSRSSAHAASNPRAAHSSPSAPAEGVAASGRPGEVPSPSNQSREALGYKQLIDHFEGRCSLDDAIEKIKIETRRFAKNQRTWLKRLRTTPNSIWIDAATTPPEAWPEIVLRALSETPASIASFRP